MKEKSIRRRGGRWLRYVLTEVIFLVVAALFVLILWGHEKRASRKRDEELLRNIVASGCCGPTKPIRIGLQRVFP